jgi:hypothetical protein
MQRFHQILLIGTMLPLCWLGMMAVHELGHVLGAIATGGTVEKVPWKTHRSTPPESPRNGVNEVAACF